MTHSELCFVACRWLASINRKYLAALFRESHYLIGELHRRFLSRVADCCYALTGHDHRIGGIS